MSKLIFLDIESLGLDQNSAILAIGCLVIDPNNVPNSIAQMKRDVLSIKLSITDQVKKYGRKVDSATVNWWSKQFPTVKNVTFKPYDTDSMVYDGLVSLKTMLEDTCDLKKSTVWTKGHFTQMLMNSINKASGVGQIFNNYRFRDVTTAIEILSNHSDNGVCEVSLEKFPDFDLKTINHHIVTDDVVYNAAMLLSCF